MQRYTLSRRLRRPLFCSAVVQSDLQTGLCRAETGPGVEWWSGRRGGEELTLHIKTIILFNLSSLVQETQRAAAGAARLAEVGVSDIHPFKRRFVKKRKKRKKKSPG